LIKHLNVKLFINSGVNKHFSISNMAQTNPSPEDALNLFKDIEKTFPSATLGDDKWQILTVHEL
jgi:hypothetical protein